MSDRRTLHRWQVAHDMSTGDVPKALTTHSKGDMAFDVNENTLSFTIMDSSMKPIQEEMDCYYLPELGVEQ